MTDERRKVLEMLTEGTITQVDATRLLEALGEEEASAKSEENQNEKQEEDQVAIAQAVPVPMLLPEKFEPCPPPQADEEQIRCETGTEGVELIEISWVSGPVEILAYDGNTIRVTEYSRRPLAEKERLSMTVYNGNLKISWMRAKNALGFLTFLSKHLVVEVPRQLAGELKTLKCENVSGKTYVNQISGGLISLTAVSGDVQMQEVSAADLHVNTVSGKITGVGFSAGKADLSSVSGSVNAFGNAESFRLESVSGSLKLQTSQCPREAKFNNVSGRICLTIPENDGFTVKYNAMSGTFRTDFPVSGNVGSKRGTAIYASGNANFSIDTTSGSMQILKCE